MTAPGVFDHPDHDGHEAVHFVADPASGLRAIIAVHDRSLGRAAGGCRIKRYPSEADALGDALRLSRGMSLKNALAGLPLGGGKSVILADPATEKTPEMMRAFGRAIDALAGAYATGEDVGCEVADMDAVKSETRWVMGASDAEGDPSDRTARGVEACLERAVARALGRDLSGVTVGVKGVGHVGSALCARLHARGARLVIAEPNEARRARAVEAWGAEAVDPDAIAAAEIDVFAPCGLGGDLTVAGAREMRARVVCGAANNQLATPEADAALHAAGVLYCPDYLVNAGGVLFIGRTVAGWTEDRALAAIEALPDTLDRVLATAEAEGAPPGAVADRLALARMAEARGR